MRTATLDAALTIARDLLNNAQIQGLHTSAKLDPMFSNSTGAEWNRGWGTSARLDVAYRKLGEDDVYSLIIDIGWSTLGSYTPSAARAAVVLHSEVTDLACLIKTQLNNLKIVKDKKP